MNDSDDAAVTIDYLENAIAVNNSADAKRISDRFKQMAKNAEKPLEKIRKQFVKEWDKAADEWKKQMKVFDEKFDLHQAAIDSGTLTDKQKAQRRGWIKTHEKRLLDAQDKLQDLRENLHARLAELVGTEKTARVKVSGAQAGTGDKVKSAEKFIGSMLSEKTAKGKIHHVECHATTDDRAFACKRDSTYRSGSGLNHEIHMNGSEDVGTYVHEIGHTLEFGSNRTAAAAQGFLYSRVEGETPSHIARYKSYEIGWSDEFGKSGMKAQYVGKFYKDGSTEVISMGLQQLHDNPVDFARVDPEHFKFIVGMLRGDFH